jgi:hypothetical protein
MSLGGDKIAFIRYHFGGRGRGFTELRIMNTDGTEEQSLVETDNRDSPFFGAFIEAVCLSPGGDRVAFIAKHFPRATTQDLWTINSDGTRLRGYDLGLPDTIYHRIVGFGDPDRALFSLYIARIKAGEGNWRQVAKLLRIDLESGQVETLADQVRKPWHAFMSMNETATSRGGRVAFIQVDEATNRESLSVYDPARGETTLVYPEDSATVFRWDNKGDKLAFLTAGSKLGIYSLGEKRVVGIAELKGYDLRWPSQALEWTSDDRLMLRRLEAKTSYMCILDANFREQKAIRLPFSTYYASRFWSVGNYAIVENTEKHELWGADLTTDKWLRIY